MASVKSYITNGRSRIISEHTLKILANLKLHQINFTQIQSQTIKGGSNFFYFNILLYILLISMKEEKRFRLLLGKANYYRFTYEPVRK